MKNLLWLNILLFLFSNALFAQNKHTQSAEKTLLVGTYTDKGSEGIYVFRFNTKTGDFKHINNTKGIKNPSFLSVSPNKKYVYSVNEEGNLGGVSAFSFNQKTGELKLLNSSSANGDHPCHVEVNPDGKYLVVGNYTGGNLSLFSLNKDGSLNPNPQTISHSGKSINAARQEKPHVHSVNWAPNNTNLFVPDLGIDKIMHYKLNKATGQLEVANPAFTAVEAGTGPRHFTFHPNGKYAYVIQELSSQITAFTVKGMVLEKIETVSTLPIDNTIDNTTADIHISPDGKFLYGSNRGHNSLAIYSINQKNGSLGYIENQSIMGKTPRNFTIDPTGNYILVANQDSNNITIFKRNKSTGKLKPTGKEIKISRPVCLKMI